MRMESSVVEGRNHVIKEMFSELGYNVLELDRKYFGQFEADIPLGKYRVISNEEIKSVYKNYNYLLDLRRISG